MFIELVMSSSVGWITDSMDIAVTGHFWYCLFFSILLCDELKYHLFKKISYILGILRCAFNARFY